MGKDKTTQSSATQYTPTEEEKQLNQLQLGQAQAFDPIQRQLNTNGGNLINNLLTGQALPGYLNSLPGGIDAGVTQGIVDDSLKDLYPQFQSNGILDSGVAAQIAGRTSADIRQNAAQFNLQNLQQLLNIGVGGQASVQSSSLNNSGQVGQRLAGLRNSTTSGSTIGMNPFLKSFQTGFGNKLGEGLGSGVSSGVGGAAGGFGKFFAGCWVASEIFGGWNEPKTVAARIYVNSIGPKWFKNIYLRFGKSFADFISNKPILKLLLKPLFEMFAKKGGYNAAK